MNSSTPINLQKAKLLLGFGVLIYAIGQSLTFVIIAPLARQVGWSEQAFGIGLTLAGLPLIFGAPFWGRKSDHMGRRNVFVIGVTGAAIGTLLVALVLQVGLNGWMSGLPLLALLVAARAAYGLLASGIYPSSTAYMIDVTDVTNRAGGLAIIGASNGMGSILGPVMAASLAWLGELVPMYAAVAIGLAGALFTLLLLPEPPRHVDARRPSTIRATDPRLRPFMIIWLAFFLTFMSVQIILAFYLQDEFGITDPKALVRLSSLMLISVALALVVVQIGVLQIFKIKPWILMRLVGPLFALSLVILLLAPTPWVMAGGFAVLGLAFACSGPGINGTASLCVDPWEQGAAMGYLSGSNTVGVILGPLVGTQIYYRLGHQAPFIIGIVALTCISLYALTIPVPKRRASSSKQDPGELPSSRG